MEGRLAGDDDDQPRRPRVVDKRVSSRPAPTPVEPSAQAAPSEPAPARDVAPPPSAAPEEAPSAPDADLWTPEQEEQARRFAEEVRATPARDWVLNSAVTLANVAATKIDAGLAADAQLAIDALAGLVNAVGPRLGDAEAPLRQTVAQLQMAFAQGPPPPPAAGGPPA
jgi:hypothetical protein